MTGWGQERFKFIATASIVDAILRTPPSTFDPFDDAGERRRNYDRVYCGRNVCWASSKGKMVRVPAANVNFMEGNQWNWAYAAAIYQYLTSRSDEPLRSPAGRIHRITSAYVKMTERFEAAGELEYQVGMTEPWARVDVGTYTAQLVDGNHRAAAALALGEPYLWVYIGENSLDEVLKKDRT